MSFVYESKLRKTNIVYDKEFGLSLEISKAFQSPIKKSSNSSSNRTSPDRSQLYCCACLELVGGRLYTCSRCSASFHSICHFPPLPPNNGKSKNNTNWNCHRCKVEIKYGRIQGTKTIPDPQEREDALNCSIIRFLLHQTERVNKRPDTFGTFVEALKAINAREFSLDNLNIDESFYRLPFDEQFTRDSIDQKPCFYCKRIVDKQMISCDYCGASFCFDCPNPPFSSLPNERFMCQLHVEPFIDSHLVTSLRVTERMALWKEHTDLPQRELLPILQQIYRKSRDDDQLFEREDCHSRKRKIVKKRIKLGRATTFEVDKTVKETYARAFGSCPSKAAAAAVLDRLDNQPSTSDFQQTMTKDDQNGEDGEILCAMAAEVLANLRERKEKPIFYPKFFNAKLPMYAALKIVSGANRLGREADGLVIPVHSQFFTLGASQLDSRHFINLSQFSTCKLIIFNEAFIFLDKSRFCFEMVSANPFCSAFRQLPSLCKCASKTGDSLLGTANYSADGALVPSPKPAVLWNGALLRIGCLRLIFAGIGAL